MMLQVAAGLLQQYSYCIISNLLQVDVICTFVFVLVCVVLIYASCVYFESDCENVKILLMFPDVSGHHHQLHTRHPRLHHGHNLPGSRDQRARLHGKSDCSSTR